MSTMQQRLAARILTVLQSPEAIALIDLEATWNAGGCWILAEAVQRFLGPPAALWCVLGRPRNSRLTFPQHVVVAWGRYFFDGHGLQSEQELLRKMRLEEGLYDVVVVPFTPQLQRRARHHDIPCPLTSVEALVKLLHRRIQQKAVGTFDGLFARR